MQKLQKLRLGGIKFSEAQVRMVLPAAETSSVPIDLSRILAGFAKHRINLHQLAYREDVHGGVELYLAHKDYQQNRIIIDSELEPLGLKPVVDEPVGTLTLFPHASRMDVLLRVMNILGGSGLRLYALCSSLSAFCITIDFDKLDAAAEVLLEYFTLPEGHSPFRYEPSDLDKKITGGEGRIVETIARYSEPVIRIYGSNLATDLTRLTVSFAGEQLPAVVEELSKSGIERFELVGLTETDSRQYSLTLIIDPNRNREAAKFLSDSFAETREIDFSLQKGLELVFFHGPHFQDRYGVIYTAASALARASLGISGAACSGTGVYLAGGKGDGSRIRDVLGEVFVVP